MHCLTIESVVCFDVDNEVSIYRNRTETEILFVKTCTYIHHHTKHLIQLYTRAIQI